MKMQEIDIKPLSVNEAWKGRRFKTDDYRRYELELFYLLPKNIEIPKGKLKVYYVFGLSSKLADGDNCIKQFQDIIANMYRFNDNRIYEWSVKKVDVEKGKEFIQFRICSYPQ